MSVPRKQIRVRWWVALPSLVVLIGLIIWGPKLQYSMRYRAIRRNIDSSSAIPLLYSTTDWDAKYWGKRYRAVAADTKNEHVKMVAQSLADGRESMK